MSKECANTETECKDVAELRQLLDAWCESYEECKAQDGIFEHTKAVIAKHDKPDEGGA